MYIPKRYGYSREDRCPFCQKLATSKNSQKIPVCQDHAKEALPDIRCVCGSFLTLMEGKFGVFFNCMNCGNMSLQKGLEMRSMKKEKVQVRKDPEVSDPGKYPGFDYGIN